MPMPRRRSRKQWDANCFPLGERGDMRIGESRLSDSHTSPMRKEHWGCNRIRSESRKESRIADERAGKAVAA